MVCILTAMFVEMDGFSARDPTHEVARFPRASVSWIEFQLSLRRARNWVMYRARRSYSIRPRVWRALELILPWTRTSGVCVGSAGPCPKQATASHIDYSEAR